jgi:hypothetical protein
MQPKMIKEHESFTVCCVIYLATVSVFRQWNANEDAFGNTSRQKEKNLLL